LIILANKSGDGAELGKEGTTLEVLDDPISDTIGFFWTELIGDFKVLNFVFEGNI
jgi:hypothetical protein